MVNLVSTWVQLGVNLGSTWGQPGVNLESTCGQPVVILESPSPRGHPGVDLHRPTRVLSKSFTPAGAPTLGRVAR